MRPCQLLLTALPALFAATSASPTDDMRSLQTTCESAASVVNRSLNTTSSPNPSETLMNIIYQIGASTANLRSSNTTASPSSWTDNPPALANATDPDPGLYDTTYLPYLAGINTLSEAFTRRGRVPNHAERNPPVYRALRGLAGAVHTYALDLRDRSMISRSATISTITAGSYLLQAQSVWADVDGDWYYSQE